MKLKKIVSSVLAGAMLASTALIGVTSVTAADELPFDDVPAKWFKNAVVTVYEEGIMQGKSDTKFDPTANITRAEVVTAFARIACTNIDGKGDALTFTDTKTGKWYSDSVGWAADNEIVKGRGDGRFSPSDNITRAELASIIINFVNYMELKLPDNPKIDKFSDASTFANWMKEPVEAVRKTGLMQGVDGKFNPKGNATRAEIAQVIANLLPSVGRVNVVEDGKTDYVIVVDEENIGAVEAAGRLQYQVEYLTGAVLDIVDDSTKADACEIVIGNVRASKIETAELTGDGYEIAVNGEKVYVGSATAEGLYRGAVRLALACVNGDDVRFTEKTEERVLFEYPIGKLTINGNDISKYKIIYPAGASANTMTGVNDLARYIEKACGVKLDAVEGTSGDFAIIVKEEVVPVKDSPNDGVENFSVKSEGNNVVITGAADRGAMYGCYDFLEDVIGWAFLTETQDYLSPVDELDIKDLDYTEAPVFEHRRTNWHLGNVQDMRNKHKMWGINAGCHSFQSLTDGEYDQSTQPCLSDPKIYERMLGNVMKMLEADPNRVFVDVSQNDNNNYCTCDDCMATYAKYTRDPEDLEAGGTAGQMIEFVNKIATEVEKKYPDVMIHTFAYMYTRHAPLGIKPNDNVFVQLCSIECCFAQPLDGSGGCNETFAEDIAEWRKLSKHLDIWDYTTNFSDACTLFPNVQYDVLAANMRLFADSNAFSVFEQGNHMGAKERGEFDRLRSYLIAKLLWDPYMSEEEYEGHVKKFMEGYFGDGWQLIYDSMPLWMDVARQVHHGCFERTSSLIMYFYKAPTERWVEIFDEAELKAETLKQFDNIDLTQIQINFIDLGVRFNKLYKSSDPAEVELSQKLSKQLQDKMLKFGVSLGNMSLCYPNFTEFTADPTQWRWDEDIEALLALSIGDVTVEYPKLSYTR